MTDGAEARMASYLKRIATGPEMSTNLTRDEARDGMTLILAGRVDPAQAAVFLIALRMKRESDDENRGVLDALRETTHVATAVVPDLVDLADPYDGFLRHLPAAPFLPAVLAACGVPNVSHGCRSMGPKFGLTHHQILTASGTPMSLSTEAAARCIENPDIGWSYVDQSAFHPDLHSLIELRRLIVKRPCLSTLEKLCGPVRASGRTHLVVGYVHSAYERLLPLVAREAGYASALVIRGVEGGVVPPLNAQARVISYLPGGADESWKLDPREAGIESDVRAVPLASTPDQTADDESFDEVSQERDLSYLAARAAEAGMEALRGKTGPTRDSLVLASAVVLRQVGRAASLTEGADLARRALDSGDAQRRFVAFSRG
ncbi:MAG: anthranilate phosphoribosyltransferase [Nitrospirae bacterium]|nr:anthranilate phosphoribosyltransferase [Nitrospirota bacterium]